MAENITGGGSTAPVKQNLLPEDINVNLTDLSKNTTPLVLTDSEKFDVKTWYDSGVVKDPNIANQMIQAQRDKAKSNEINNLTSSEVDYVTRLKQGGMDDASIRTIIQNQRANLKNTSNTSDLTNQNQINNLTPDEISYVTRLKQGGMDDSIIRSVIQNQRVNGNKETAGDKILSENEANLKLQEAKKQDLETKKEQINTSSPAIYQSYSDAYDSSIGGSIDTKKKVDQLKADYQAKIDALGTPVQTNISSKYQEFYNSPEYKAQSDKVNLLKSNIDQYQNDLNNIGKKISDTSSASTSRSYIDAKVYVNSALLQQKIDSATIKYNSELNALNSKKTDFDLQMKATEEDEKNKLALYDRQIDNINSIFSIDKYALDAEIEAMKEDRQNRMSLKLKDIETKNALIKEQSDLESQKNLLKYKSDLEASASDASTYSNDTIDTFATRIMEGSNAGDILAQVASTTKDKNISLKVIDSINNKINSKIEEAKVKYKDDPEKLSLITTFYKTFANKSKLSETQVKSIGALTQLYNLQDSISQMITQANKDNIKAGTVIEVGGYKWDPSNLITALKGNNANEAKNALGVMLTASFGLAKPLTGDSGQLSNQDVERISSMMQDPTKSAEANKAISDVIKKFAISGLKSVIKSNTDKSFGSVQNEMLPILESGGTTSSSTSNTVNNNINSSSDSYINSVL